LNDQYTINNTKNNLDKQQQLIKNRHSSSSIPNKDTTIGAKMASKFEMKICLNTSTNKIDINYQWKTAAKKARDINSSMLELIVDLCFIPLTVLEQKSGVKLYGLTEYSCNGMKYRADPCYKNEMPWYDWVLIAWNSPKLNHILLSNHDSCPDYVELPNMHNDNDNTSTFATLIPAQLICIIQEESGEVFAIVHSCLQYRKKISVLTYRWQLEYRNIKICRNSDEHYLEIDKTLELIPVYHKVSIDSIQKHCLMIPFESDSQYWMEVIEQELWANAFSDV